MTRAAIDRLARVIAATLATMPFMSLSARADTTSGVGMSGSLEYSSNPYLLDAGTRSVTRGRVLVSPFVEERTARSSLRVSGDASFSKFSRRYRDAVDLSAVVGYTNRVTSQLLMTANVSINSTIGGTYNTAPVFSATPPGSTVPPITDFTVIGTQDRTTQAQASTGVNYTIDPKNSLSLSYSGSVLRYPVGVVRDEYSTVSQNAGYTRVLNSRLSAGGSVSVTRINYFNTKFGDAVIISPSLNGNFRISSQWSLSAGIGVSKSRLTVVSGRLTSTNLSGNFSACRTDARMNFCLNASRATGASSFDGIRVTTTVGASLEYKVNARDKFTASGGLSRASVPDIGLPGTASQYLSGQTGYSRQFNSRLTGAVSGGFTEITQLGRRSNAFASIGITYNFGR